MSQLTVLRCSADPLTVHLENAGPRQDERQLEELYEILLVSVALLLNTPSYSTLYWQRSRERVCQNGGGHQGHPIRWADHWRSAEAIR
jgi:hypothetical protein